MVLLLLFAHPARGVHGNVGLQVWRGEAARERGLLRLEPFRHAFLRSGRRQALRVYAEGSRQPLHLCLEHEHLAGERDDHAHQARRLRVARTELAELGDEVGPFGHYSTLIFASAITFCHFTFSLRWNAASPSGVPVTGSRPMAASLALSSALLMAAFSAPLSRSSTGRGIPAGP